MPKKPAAVRSKSTPKRSPSTKKKVSTTQHASAAAEPRRLHVPKYHWYNPKTWQYAPKAAPDQWKPLSKSRVLLWKLLQLLWANKKLFAGIVIIFGLLNVVLVRGLSGSSDLSGLKSSLDSTFHGVGGEATSSLLSFTYLLANSGSGNSSTSGVYQTMSLIVCSLAFIWALRQVIAGHHVGVRDSFYKGMYPIIPFLLVLGLLGIQLIPMFIGGGLYSAVVSNGIAAQAYEKILWLALFIATSIWSLRMATATLFALYIVTLNDMTPLVAYRNARNLVRGRRLIIWRKIILLPIMLLLIAAVIELPLILFLTPVAVWSFFILTMCMLPVIHGYLYTLYRELL